MEQWAGASTLAGDGCGLGTFGWDNKFGYGRVDACAAVGACDVVLRVEIDGPSEVPSEPEAPCTWNAVVHGGNGSNSYQWSGVLSGTGPSVSGEVSSSGWLYLDVSSGGQNASDKLYITVSQFAPECEA